MDVMQIRRRMMADAPQLYTATGAVASFSTNMVAPLKSCVVEFAPVQEGSGDPSPTNVRPITGWTGCDVQQTGKNLLDVDLYGKTLPFTQNDIRWSKVSNGVYHAKGTASGTSYFNVTFNNTLSSSMPCIAFRGQRLYLSVTNNLITPYMGYFKQDGTYSQLTNGSIIPNDAVGFRSYLRIGSGTVIDSDFSVQLELGSTASSYTPYTGTTYPISWQSAGTVYGGNVNPITGVLTVDRVYAEYTSVNGFITYSAWAYAPNSVKIQKSPSYAVADYLKTYNSTSNTSSMPDFSITSMGGQNNIFSIRLDSNYTSKDDYNAYLAQHPLHVCLKLATPITYQLTPTQIKSLIGQNNIFSDTNGNTTVQYWKH